MVFEIADNHRYDNEWKYSLSMFSKYAEVIVYVTNNTFLIVSLNVY